MKSLPLSEMKFLPKGFGLVCEGGGIRGFFSAGVFDGFLKARMQVPYVCGVSAGADNSVSLISGQYHRNFDIVQNHISKPEYVSVTNFIKYRSIFGLEYVFDTINAKYLPFDFTAFYDNPADFWVGCTDCKTGKAKWYNKSQLHSDFRELKASSSIPLLSPIFEIDGDELLDGGFASPIPIQKSIDDGNEFHIIVLTQNPGYQKKPAGKGMTAISKFTYSKYPHLIEVMENRHKIYNAQLAQCEDLERAGKALILRPLRPLQVGRTTQNIQKVTDLYMEGESLGFQSAQALLSSTPTN